jgi:hypothetical protein
MNKYTTETALNRIFVIFFGTQAKHKCIAKEIFSRIEKLPIASCQASQVLAKTAVFENHRANKRLRKYVQQIHKWLFFLDFFSVSITVQKSCFSLFIF